jgi:hypothetical protein
LLIIGPQPEAEPKNNSAMQWSPFKSARAFLIGTVLLAGPARADFIPIPLTSDSFNQDIIVENTAPPPLMPVTTASMDGGTANTGFSWYERGYHPVWTSSGLPVAGSILSSDVPGHDYLLAPNYKSNNAVMIDSTLTSATLTLSAPSAYSRLSFLASAGNGPGTVQYTIHHQNSTIETGTLNCPDWLSSVNEAYIASGRVEVNDFTIDGVTFTYPVLFSRDVSLANTTNPVTQIDFAYVSGAAHNAIFAVSGSTNQVDPFSPIVVTGFNVDLVVESTAPRRERLITATTASMEAGVLNSSRTWYEKGYYPLSPTTGLPPAGSIFTNASAPDHRYLLPSSYSAHNAAMFDADFPTASLSPVVPTAYSAVSFLCAAGHGPVTNQCIINHANGSAQTNLFVIPNWFDAASAAFVASGDLDLSFRMVDSVGANNPRLYAVDIPLGNTVSAVANVMFTFTGGPANSHAAILAMSGLSGQGTIIRPMLSITPISGGNLQLSTTQAGQLQSTTSLNGTNTIWQNEGIISSTLTIRPAPGVSGKFYRVLAQ